MESSSPNAWRPVAGTLLGVGWGANQFTPLLLVYRSSLHLGSATLEAIFGVYALGLIPGLLLGGPLADRFGRRRVVRAVALLSPLASAVLMLGVESSGPLFAGRLLAGLVSGAVFSAGAAWLKELSAPPYDHAPPGTGARRAAISMTLGFGLGPLVAGTLAQWVPGAAVIPYLAHLLVMAMVLPPLWRVPETLPAEQVAAAAAGPSTWARLRVPRATHPRFLRVVAPMAPWVFAAPAVAIAFLPTLVTEQAHGYAVAFSAAVTGLVALAGVLVQPAARRLDRAGGVRGAVTGLGVASAGMALAALAASDRQPLLVVVAALALGAAYGLCLVAGLLEVQRLAGPDDLASLTAVYYALTYLGFAAPYLLASAAKLLAVPWLLLAAAMLALLTAAGLPGQSARATRSVTGG
jgi:hypothetical protein